MNLPRVLILAGGFGTRLKHLLPDIPKPLAPIAGRPFLDYQIESLQRAGFRNITLLTGYKAEQISSHYDKNPIMDVELEYFPETTPLGTGGAIGQAMRHYNESEYLVLNGDSLFVTDLLRLLKLSTKSIFSMALKLEADCSRYGKVTTDSEYRITAFLEKDPKAGEGFINAGIYRIQKEMLKYFSENGPSSFEQDVLPAAIKKESLLGIVCGGPFVDIGTEVSYKWSQSHLPKWLERKPMPCLFLDRDGVLVRHKPYMHKISDIELIPETLELIEWANNNQWPVVVVSNQAGVARKLFNSQDCENVHEEIDQRLKNRNLAISAWHFCTHHPDFDRESFFRKPHPGMLLKASEDLAIDFSRSIMIGDNESDQIMMPGLKIVLIQGDHPLKNLNAETKVATSLQDLKTLFGKVVGSAIVT